MPTPDKIEQYFDLLSPLFDALQKLGVKGWEMALRQNYIYVIQDILVLVFATILFLIVLNVMNRACKSQIKGRDEGEPVYYKGLLDFIAKDDTDDAAAAAFVLIIILICWASVFFGEMFPIINRLINPEWTTLQDVANLIGSMAGGD